MRSPIKSATKRVTDAESELNLPPGFRFHPTDEELIVHYLCRKSQFPSDDVRSVASVSGNSPPPIIADVDLYKHDPWELPEMALFGTKEWYFFTPRDRKYPNGSRPNRVTGNGYWKATGADKPIKAKSDENLTIGIKKALVFYAGKGIKGLKTNWIMHEYRLAVPNPAPLKHTNATISKLNDWVLCRLYNKKNNPKEIVIIPEDHNNNNNNNIHHSHLLHPASPLQKQNSSSNSDSFDSFEYSDGEFDFSGDIPPESLKFKYVSQETNNIGFVDDGNEWLDSLSLEDLQNCLQEMPPDHEFYDMPMIYGSNQEFLFNN